MLEVGPGPELSRRHPDARPLNANGQLVTPGLVDCHTHMIFAGHRAAELQRRLRGESYAAIAAAGGGIRSTVARDRGRARRHAREVAGQPARALARQRLHHGRGEERLRAHPFGRDAPARADARRRPARAGAAAPHRAAAARAAARVPGAARGVPRRHDRAACCPTSRRASWRAPWTSSATRWRSRWRSAARCCSRARELGLDVKLHADQFERSGGALLAAELGACSADHLECATAEDWKALGEAGVVGVLLPAAALTLRAVAARGGDAARAAARAGPISTDFNPGTSPAQSLLECAALAARLCGFDAEETLLGITWNAARALRVEAEVGPPEPRGLGRRGGVGVRGARGAAVLAAGGAPRHGVHARRRPGAAVRRAAGVAVRPPARWRVT